MSLDTAKPIRTRRPQSLLRACVAIVAALALVACSNSGGGDSNASRDDANRGVELVTTVPKASGEVDKVAWNIGEGEPSTLDAMQLSSPSDGDVIANLCDPLVREFPDGTVKPALAQSVEQVSPTRVRITLAEGRTFWDGKPVTVEDVQYSLDRVRTDERSLWANTFLNVKEFEIVDDRTIDMILAAPDTYMISWMRDVAATAIYEKAFIEKAGDAFGTPQGGIMCSGPFKLAKWNAGQNIQLERNDNYWDEELTPKAKTVEISFITDPNTITLALKSGQIDGAYGAPMSGVDQLRGASSEGKLYFGPSKYVLNLIINKADGAWADPRVREALALSIPYQHIVAAFWKGAAEPARSSLAPGAWPIESEAAYQDAWDAIPEPKQDIAKAKQLLDEAGAAGTALTLGSPSDDEPTKQTINAIADGAKQAGFKVDVDARPTAVYATDMFNPKAVADVDVLSAAWNTDIRDPRILYKIFTVGFWSGIAAKDERFNQLFAATIPAETPEARAEAVIALQTYANELRDWIPVVYTYNSLWMNKRITGAPVIGSAFHFPFLATVGAP